MEQIIFRPKLYKFDTLKAFTDEFKVGGSDLILTNKYIYDPYSDNNKCGAQVIYQEEFGGGEPTDTMVDAIIAEASKKHFERVIAIGGSTLQRCFPYPTETRWIPSTTTRTALQSGTSS